jgi:hypothetical protein
MFSFLKSIFGGKPKFYEYTAEEAKSLCWAKWDEYYYPGIIKSDNGGEYQIQFLDGVLNPIDKTLVILYAEAFDRNDLKIEGNWEMRGGYYPCVVLERNNNEFKVRYTQDNVVEVCKLHQIRIML